MLGCERKRPDVLDRSRLLAVAQESTPNVGGYLKLTLMASSGGSQVYPGTWHWLAVGKRHTLAPYVATTNDCIGQPRTHAADPERTSVWPEWLPESARL